MPSLRCRHPVRTGFTLIELLVVISIIAVLAALLLPAVKAVQAAAKASRCASAMGQIFLGYQGYAGENEDALPYAAINGPGLTTQRWADLIAPYLEAANAAGTAVDLSHRTVLTGCPEWAASQIQSWTLGIGTRMNLDVPDRPLVSNRLNLTTNPTGANVVEFRFGLIRYPSSRALGSDSADYWIGTGVTVTDWQGSRHRNRANGLFCDGHLQPITTQTAWNNAINRPDLGLP